MLVDVSVAHDIFFMFDATGRNVVMTFLRGMYKDPRWVGVSADVTIPVMVSAVRYFLLTFGTCNLKNSAAGPLGFRRGPPAESEKLAWQRPSRLHWSEGTLQSNIVP